MGEVEYQPEGKDQERRECRLSSVSGLDDGGSLTPQEPKADVENTKKNRDIPTLEKRKDKIISQIPTWSKREQDRKNEGPFKMPLTSNVRHSDVCLVAA